MPHVVSLQVPDGYQLSAEWSTRSPHEVATLLDVAVQLSSLVSEHHLEDHVRGWLDGGFERHSRASESKIQDLHRSLAQSEATLLQTEARVDSAMASTRLECESRLQRLQMQYDHLELEVEARKQEAEAHCRAKARAEVEEKISHLESQLEESRNARLIAEVKTLETMQAKCVDVERYSHDCQQLRERISELETPMARGRSGELDVSQALSAIGFHVEDTSMGEKKDSGFLDLLVRPEEDTEGMRIAVEIKTVKTVQKRDLDDFERKVKSGLERGMFDAAVFVSLRTHTKKGGSVHLEMYEDDRKRPLVPVAWIGTEKSKFPSPLTQEQLETHMLLQMQMLGKCHDLQVAYSLPSDDTAERVAIQQCVDSMQTHMQASLAEMGKQSKLLDEMRASLTHSRASCVRMFSDLFSINKQTPWLQRPMEVPWMECLETASSRMETMKEAEVWNAFSRQKSLIERTVGKEALFLVAREASAKKRGREEGE